jgi:hypothetical protein
MQCFVLVSVLIYMLAFLLEVQAYTKGKREGRAIAQASHRGDLGSSSGQVMWDLWWTKWHWGRFSPSTSVSPANSYFTDCATFIIIIIIYHPGLVQ